MKICYFCRKDADDTINLISYGHYTMKDLLHIRKSLNIDLCEKCYSKLYKFILENKVK